MPYSSDGVRPNRCLLFFEPLISLDPLPSYAEAQVLKRLVFRTSGRSLQLGVSNTRPGREKSLRSSSANQAVRAEELEREEETEGSEEERKGEPFVCFVFCAACGFRWTAA